MTTLLISLGATFAILNFIIDAYQRSETTWQDFLSIWDRAEGDGNTSTSDMGNPAGGAAQLDVLYPNASFPTNIGMPTYVPVEY